MNVKDQDIRIFASIEKSKGKLVRSSFVRQGCPISEASVSRRRCLRTRLFPTITLRPSQPVKQTKEQERLSVADLLEQIRVPQETGMLEFLRTLIFSFAKDESFLITVSK